MSEKARKLALRLDAAGSALGRGVRKHPWWPLAAGIVGFVLLVVLVIRWAPQWLADTRGLEGAEVGEEKGRVRTALLAFVAGLVAFAGAIFTGLTFALSRRGQHIDRFTKAVDQLGNAAIDVRLGGIYALERLVREAPGYHAPVMDVLAAFIRVHGAASVEGDPSSVNGLLRELTRRVGRELEAPRAPGRPPPAAADVSAAFGVLARRDVGLESTPPRFDLRGLNLSGVRAKDIHLKGADLSGAHLEDARLEGAQLQDAIFVGAFLDDARFGDADLTGASLEKARLANADLSAVKGLDPAKLKHATYSRLAERFPAGFDRAAADLKPISVDDDAPPRRGASSSPS